MKSKKDKKNIKALKKFMKQNKKVIDSWLNEYVELFNKCGTETQEGAVQMGFAGSVMTGMLETMKNMPREEKLLLLDKMREHIEKQ